MNPPGNDPWVRDLARPGPRREERVSELRDYLLKGLRRALAGRFHADTQVLEDFTQEAILRILDRLESFRGESRFTTWALSVAIRVAFSEMRRRHWRERSLDSIIENDDCVPAALEETERPQAGSLIREEILAALYRVIREQLTERQRLALVGELKGMPLEVIAEKLDTKRNALYKLLHDARLRLKKGLERESISAEEVRSAFDL